MILDAPQSPPRPTPTPPSHSPPEPPPALKAAIARFASEHPAWASPESAWTHASESPHAFLAAATAQGALSPSEITRGGDGCRTLHLFGQSRIEHVVVQARGWLVDTSARRFRPLDPQWPRVLEARESRRFFRAEEFTDPWAPTPCPRKEALEWARDGMLELVPEAPMLHLAVRDRRFAGWPMRALVLLGLPPDRGAAPSGERVAEVAPVWRRYDEQSVAAAMAGIARAVRAAKALGFAAVVGYVPGDPQPDPSDPFGGEAWPEFESGRGWAWEDAGCLPTFLRPRQGRAGEKARLQRRKWDAEIHEMALFLHDEEMQAREERLGRQLTEEEEAGVSFDLGTYDHASQSWRVPAAYGSYDDEAQERYRMTFAPQDPALRVAPLSRAEAHAFVDEHHAHHWPPAGEALCLGVFEHDELRCALTFGRPEARRLQERGPWIGEVTRVACMPGGGRREGGHASNWASKVLGAVREVAEALGYTRLVSYTLLGEGGASYTGAGYAPSAVGRGGQWDRPSRPRARSAQPGLKVRWEVGRDAALPSKAEVAALLERVRAAKGTPLPSRPPPPSPRYVVERAGKLWVPFDRIRHAPAGPSGPKADATREAAALEAKRRNRVG